MSAGKSRLFAMLVAALASAAFAGCGGSDSSSGDAEFKGDGYPGVDAANSRFVEGPIDRSSAAQLEVAWTLPLTAKSTFGSYASTPVMSKGVVYSQDLESNVQAIDLASGDVLWEKAYNDPDQGPNGVVVVDGRVFGATSSEAFALDQESGEELWSTKVLGSSAEAIDIAPGYHEGLVYFSTVPTNVNAEYPAGGVGTLWALDAESGKKMWHFDTVPKSLWGKQNVNGGGGLWYAPSFDQEGFMYFGTGNPSPFPGTASEPWGSSRPGPNLYTNSMVKLDAKTGKMQWHYQQTPHDVYDWDFQDSPILLSAGGNELAIGAGKSGVVVAVDAQTGKPVWKRPVGRHNGHDRDSLYAMRGEYSKIKAGEVFPGSLGGVIAPMASDGSTVFVPVVNHPLSVSPQQDLSEGRGLTGEMVAIDAGSGRVRWKKSYPAPVFGSPVAVNDMVFFTSFDGTVQGLDAKSGGEVWSGSLPASSNTGVVAGGDTLLVPAGLPTAEGQTPELVAYRLGGGE